MDIAPFVESLRRDLAAAAAPGGPEVTRAAELLGGSIDASARLCLLDALAQAADEVTSQAHARPRVELRLRGREAELVVTEAPARSRPSHRRPADATRRHRDAHRRRGDVTRITLRLPEQLKDAVERAAAGEGISVNAWLVRAIGARGRAAARRAPARRLDRPARPRPPAHHRLRPRLITRSHPRRSSRHARVPGRRSHHRRSQDARPARVEVVAEERATADVDGRSRSTAAASPAGSPTRPRVELQRRHADDRHPRPDGFRLAAAQWLIRVHRRAAGQPRQRQVRLGRRRPATAASAPVDDRDRLRRRRAPSTSAATRSSSTASGDVRLDRVDGHLRVKGASGDLRRAAGRRHVRRQVRQRRRRGRRGRRRRRRSTPRPAT